mmetsp:Transcript_21302/g.32802  ORF Transcript_21302/g.32802 Transcript_21302/m.32802 type:complete len:597 (+) Transcript_21302:89-1879(+)|eukprot:CAMPEP_0195299700 /NCGR_PEP_ID=MMETSP0707-20130614/26027_1 /TAXON_ID=33640 /ORGANISM="Asterionellopsis glacialis, Strain CCMP134" /LENGTH=596 /DNA_ID=CAMNT_0040362173 /DNA_START=64 /DNA_END=1854 /DNA_ORIENTATION=+
MLNVLIENPMYAIVAVTLLYAVVFQWIMHKPEPEKDMDPSFDSMLGDDAAWGSEEEKKDGPPAKSIASEKELPPEIKQQMEAATKGGNTTQSPSMPMPGGKQVQLPAGPNPKPRRPDDGTFQLGDRVVLKNLISAKDLNGRHGVVAGEMDKKTQRYPVDFDLFDAKKSSVSVKEGNMKRESPLPADTDEAPCEVKNGCLTEAHAKAASFILTSMRNLISNTLKGEKDMNKLAAFAWTFWQTPDGKGVYPSLAKFMKEDIVKLHGIEKLEMQMDAENPKGAYQLTMDAVDDQRAVKGWNVRAHGEYWILGMNQDGTYLAPVSNIRSIYLVCGLRIPLGAQVAGHFPRPPKFRITLLPWYGRIFHDIHISTTTGNAKPEVASEELFAQLRKNVAAAVQEGRVISRFAQLEVSDGSKDGLVFGTQVTRNSGQQAPGQQQQQGGQPGMPTGPPNPAEYFKDQKPATQEEQGLIDDVTMMEAFPMPQKPAPGTQPTDEQKLAIWNFIRAGETKESNPDNAGVILTSGGKAIGNFKMSGETSEPSSVDILKAMMGLAAKIGKRPAFMGVDHPETAKRLQFLLQGVQGTKVLPIQVQRKPMKK